MRHLISSCCTATESAVAKFDLQKSRPEEEESDASGLPASRRCRARTWPDNRRASDTTLE